MKKNLFTHEKTLKGIEEYTYTKNGLKLLYVHMPGCDTVTSNIVYLVGSRHEARGETGIAHMLEHMMFKDTKDKNGKKAPVPRYIGLQNKGALLNASTWTDRTNYYFVMPSEYLGDMLQAESERMRGLILTPKEFKPEQQNVLSEYEMYADRPDFILNTAMTAQAFVSHGYGHETIGYKSDIEHITCESLKAFYDTYYWPNNAYLIVTGDVAREKVFPLVDEHFGYIKASPKPIPHPTIVEPASYGTRTVHIVRKNPVTLTALAYRAPHSADPAWVHAYVWSLYLAGGKLSPLYKRLVETNMVSSLAPSLMPSYDPYLMSFTATVAHGVAVEDVQKILAEEIERTRTKEISKSELTRIKNKVLADIAFERDGAHAVARELTEYVASGDWTQYYSILENIEKVTSSEIHAFAKKWCTDTDLIIGTFKGS